MISTSLSFDQMYAAMERRDTSFEGSFVVGVKTTGIFCRPGCTARTPKRENVAFYNGVQEALQHGFRPCKVCLPQLPAQAVPSEIKSLLKDLAKDPFVKIKDQDLRNRTLEPATVRRWFKKHHGITFHAYQRMLRINAAFKKLKSGQNITAAAFDSGFESLSGFGEGFKSVFGTSPSDAVGKQVINIVRFTTLLGPMFGCASDRGVCLCEFTDRKMLETEFKDLCKRLNAVILPGNNVFLDQLQTELKEYFEGQRTTFGVALHTPGTEFQQQVWTELGTIPFGNTRSYKAQAQKLGNLKAIRAVATANGMNRIAIVIPCHRVIGSDGALTGYAGGLHRKRWLLDFESGQGELF